MQVSSVENWDHESLTKYELKQGQVGTITSVYNGKDISDEIVAVSLNPDVVQVSGNKFIPLKTGKAQILAYYDTGEELKEITFDVETKENLTPELDNPENLEGNEINVEAWNLKTLGLYNENNELIMTWDELIELGLDIEKKYTSENYKTDPTSGYLVFKNNDLSGKLVIPDSITKIGDFVFRECKSLTAIIIGNKVTTIGNNAFDNCSSLESIDISDSVVEINFATFRNCELITSIIIPHSVTKIGDYGFYKCGLKTLTLPDTLKTIGAYAFSNNDLKSVIIPNTFSKINGSIFNNCQELTAIIALPNNPYYCTENGVLFSKNKQTLVTCPTGKLRSPYVIPDYVTTIGNNVFAGSKTITSVGLIGSGAYLEIPDSVTKIDEGAFSSCAELVTVELPDSITNIGTGIFKDCGKLTSIILPKKITKIPIETFKWCTSLKSIKIPDSVTKIEQNAFAFCRQIGTIGLYGSDACLEIPNSVINIEQGAFNSCGATTVVLPDSITDISSYVFPGCTELTSIVLPNSLTGLYGNTFQ